MREGRKQVGHLRPFVRRVVPSVLPRSRNLLEQPEKILFHGSNGLVNSLTSSILKSVNALTPKCLRHPIAHAYSCHIASHITATSTFCPQQGKLTSVQIDRIDVYIESCTSTFRNSVLHAAVHTRVALVRGVGIPPMKYPRRTRPAPSFAAEV